MSETALTVRDVAAYLRTSPDSIHQHWKRWGLPFYRVGSRLLMNPMDLRDWEQSQRETA